MDFKSKYGPWALVAGGSEGIGEQFVRQIAAKGLNVFIIARGREKLERVAQSVREDYKVSTQIWDFDLANEDLLERLKQQTNDLEIGLIVYNAAISLVGEFLDHTIEDHKRLLTVNCVGPMIFCHHFGQIFKSKGKGGIILMSSMAGFQGSAMVANYAGSKAYDTVLAEGLWNELQEHGVDVLVCPAGSTSTPGYLNTNPKKSSTPKPPVSTPELVAKTALDGLGKKMEVIPGFWNNLSTFFITKLMPRSAASKMVSKTTKDMYQ